MINTSVGAWVRRRQPELKLGLRITVAGVVSYALAVFLSLPQGTWAVFTAVLVTQASVGGSVKATLDRLAGTLSGALYGAAVATLVPHGDPLAMSVALGLTLAPLAILAAVNPMFRVAPMTATILLLGTAAPEHTPLVAALYRILEVIIGGLVGLVVSLLVLPARAHAVAVREASRVLGLIADLLAMLSAALLQPVERAAISALHEKIQSGFDKLEAAAAEAEREKRSLLTVDADVAAIPRTLRRLYHDLVVIGRVGAQPLSSHVHSRLAAPLAEVSQKAADFLRRSGEALNTRTAPPAGADLHSAILRLIAELWSGTPGKEDEEKLATLRFAFEQLARDLTDLQARGTELSRRKTGAAVAP